MSIRLTIAALALIFSSASYAESFELDLTQLRLPATQTGFVSYRTCDTCNFRRSQTSDSTVFEINGNAVTFDQFRRTANGAPNKNKALVTVLYDEESRRITLISVRIRNRAG